MVHHNKLKLH